MAVARVARLTEGTLVETDDRWVLPLSGRTVDRLCLDFAITLTIRGGLEVKLESPFVLQRADRSEVLLVPDGDAERLSPVMSLVRGTATRVEAFKDGRLEVVFADGSKLRVPADEDFEAWQLVGPDGLLIVSLPGGELAVWRPEDKPRVD